VKRILILGGGFAAITAARKLEKLLRPGEAIVELVSRENFSVFTPMLPEVSSGGLEPRHISTPVRAELRHTKFYLAEVGTIDIKAQRVTILSPITETTQVLEYDQLVLALGSVTSTFNLPGIDEFALPLKTLEDAERLRNHVIAMLELAQVEPDPARRARLLTFVFVGGGFTGVEAVGEMMDFFRSVVRYYPSIAAHEVHGILIEGGNKLLIGLQDGMGEYSLRSLERRGVDVRLSTMVAGADADGLLLKGGEHIPTGTIVWSAGVKPSPNVEKLGLETRRGAIVTNADMSVPGFDNVWAAGDCASIPDQNGAPYPATAQHALREGPVLAHNIVARLRGEPTEPFVFSALGMMASLGGRSGVAGLFGKYLLTGFPAWFLWRTYYLARLPGIDRRLRVTFDWTLNMLFPRDTAELRLFSQRYNTGLSPQQALGDPHATPASATADPPPSPAAEPPPLVASE
jgi:NADH dehydrogenase